MGVTLFIVDGQLRAQLDDEPLPEGAITWGLHLDDDVVDNFGEED